MARRRRSILRRFKRAIRYRRSRRSRFMRRYIGTRF